MASPSPLRCAHALALLVTSASMRATAMPRPLASGLPPPAPAAALAEKLVEISFDIVPWRRSEGAELAPFARRLMPSSAPDELAALISTVDPAAVMEQSGSTTSVSITSPTSEEVLSILRPPAPRTNLHASSHAANAPRCCASCIPSALPMRSACNPGGWSTSTSAISSHPLRRHIPRQCHHRRPHRGRRPRRPCDGRSSRSSAAVARSPEVVLARSASRSRTVAKRPAPSTSTMP